MFALEGGAGGGRHEGVDGFCGVGWVGCGVDVDGDEDVSEGEGLGWRDGEDGVEGVVDDDGGLGILDLPDGAEDDGGVGGEGGIVEVDLVFEGDCGGGLCD